MKKNLILFVNDLQKESAAAIWRFNKSFGTNWRPVVIRDSASRAPQSRCDLVITCDYRKPEKIIACLKNYQDRLLGVVCRSEKHIANFAQLVPFLPYLKTPSKESLLWSTDKVEMRRRLKAYDPGITPKFMAVSNAKKATIQEVIAKLSFPVVVKPANLSMSLLVNLCHDETELTSVLRKTFKNIVSIYQENGRSEAPRVLVEQFMTGEMYSVDVYVNERGRIEYCPFVEVKTGRSIGFDDFFGYQQLTPAPLSKALQITAKQVTEAGIKALGLRSVTAHVELMRYRGRFKIIEIGPRLGGFRTKLYELAYGIDHALNDILIRVSRPVILPKKRQGYAVVFKIFAKREGRLKSINGLNKIKQLDSFVSAQIKLTSGEYCRFAKNGGKSVINLIMSNRHKTALLADIQIMEKCLVIKLA